MLSTEHMPDDEYWGTRGISDYELPDGSHAFGCCWNPEHSENDGPAMLVIRLHDSGQFVPAYQRFLYRLGGEYKLSDCPRFDSFDECLNWINLYRASLCTS